MRGGTGGRGGRAGRAGATAGGRRQRPPSVPPLTSGARRGEAARHVVTVPGHERKHHVAARQALLGVAHLLGQACGEGGEGGAGGERGRRAAAAGRGPGCWRHSRRQHPQLTGALGAGVRLVEPGHGVVLAAVHKDAGAADGAHGGEAEVGVAPRAVGVGKLAGCAQRLDLLLLSGGRHQHGGKHLGHGPRGQVGGRVDGGGGGQRGLAPLAHGRKHRDDLLGRRLLLGAIKVERGGALGAVVGDGCCGAGSHEEQDQGRRRPTGGGALHGGARSWVEAQCRGGCGGACREGAGSGEGECVGMDLGRVWGSASAAPRAPRRTVQLAWEC